MLVLAFYGGLFFLNRAQKEAQETLIANIEEKTSAIRPETLREIFLLEKRLTTIKTLITNHTVPSRIFDFLEERTHPHVRFINFTLTGNSRTVTVDGETVSYQALTQQIGILERDPQIEEVQFGGLSLGSTNVVLFQLTIIFKQPLIQPSSEI